jgi:nitrate/TMAO reductase-like tetraheme cytochrome c subunit
MAILVAMMAWRSCLVRKHGMVNGRRSRAALVLAIGAVLVGILALGLVAWVDAAPVSAGPAETGDLMETPTDAGVGSGQLDEVIPPSVKPAAGSDVADDPTAPRPYLDKNNCLSCHGDPSLKNLMTKERPDGSSVELYVDRAGLSFSVHRFNDCTACHTAKPHEVQTPLTKLSLAEKCGSCHEHQYTQYIQSVHGAPQASGNSDPASCVDCHSTSSNPHNIVRVLEPSATTYPRNIAETCAKCHNDSKLMGKYGIVEKVYDSYMRSFHGKATNLSGESASLQQLNKATCVNCHGAHNIALTSDPKSPVAGMENLAKTCEQCHPGAGVEFAKGFLGHKEAEPDHIAPVFWGEKFFYVFTRVVLAGGVVLVAAPFGRSIVNRVKRRREPPKKEE